MSISTEIYWTALRVKNACGYCYGTGKRSFGAFDCFYCKGTGYED